MAETNSKPDLANLLGLEYSLVLFCLLKSLSLVVQGLATCHSTSFITQVCSGNFLLERSAGPALRCSAEGLDCRDSIQVHIFLFFSPCPFYKKAIFKGREN